MFPSILALGFALAPQSPTPTQSPTPKNAFWRKHLGATRDVLDTYFAGEVEAVAAANRVRGTTAESWQRDRPRLRRELREMLGLEPMPERTHLKPVITGTVRHDGLGIVVEKLHFQSRPGLYVTANLYRPQEIAPDTRLPGILYLCGHGREKKNGYSYGNKTHYQHHPAWFASHGYTCLIVDTLQLGEIEGAHHGTHRLDQWWWVRRGYTPAGVETWNSIRALDYLCSLPYVDSKRIGVTGRSGGGVGTWYLAALDDRPAVLVPVAGLTDLRNHVVTGCVEGHCDCNFLINYYRWDFYRVACLAAPRPLLLCNSDTDTIFPLDGVMRLHAELRAGYGFYRATGKLGLLITAGPHKDTQDLRVPAFRWMERWLNTKPDALVTPAKRAFQIEQLRVFSEFPKDARNKTIQETFVDAAKPRGGEDPAAWRKRAVSRLLATTFRGAKVPADARLVEVRRAAPHGRDYVLHTGDTFRLPVRVFGNVEARELELRVEGELPGTLPAADRQGVGNGGRAVAYVVPRGFGPTRWPFDPRKRNQIRRRFLILGRTLDQTRVYDVRAAVRALRVLRNEALKNGRSMTVGGRGRFGEMALFAALLEPTVEQVRITGLPRARNSHLTLLGVSRVVTDADLPSLLAKGRAILHR